MLVFTRPIVVPPVTASVCFFLAAPLTRVILFFTLPAHANEIAWHLARGAETESQRSAGPYVGGTNLFSNKLFLPIVQLRSARGTSSACLRTLRAGQMLFPVWLRRMHDLFEFAQIRSNAFLQNQLPPIAFLAPWKNTRPACQTDEQVE